MNYYPVFLNLEGKTCLVVGGGNVAYRKAVSLARAGARVMVVAPEISSLFAVALASSLKNIRCVKRGFRPGDLAGKFLAIAATDDSKVNMQVRQIGSKRGVLVNVVDQPRETDFIVPSLFKKGELMVAISTGGASPALAKRLRQFLEKKFDTRLTTAVKKLRKSRKKNKGLSSDEKHELLSNLLKDSKISL